jgi:hypothetical protein
MNLTVALLNPSLTGVFVFLSLTFLFLACDTGNFDGAIAYIVNALANFKKTPSL